jgi:penicillin-binding protein 2
LFICYAPVDKPTIAISVVVENGGHGGSTAAPIAQKGLAARLAPELWLAQKREAARADSLLVAHGGPRAPFAAHGHRARLAAGGLTWPMR